MSAKLSVTFIDVGWGDSILIEHEDVKGRRRYALVDSNDTSSLRPTFTFLRRHFDRNGGTPSPAFEFVLMTHNHADHYDGLKSVIRSFGTKWLLYPPSAAHPALASLVKYARRATSKVRHDQAVDAGTSLKSIASLFPGLGLDILWPRPGQISTNENMNSVVLRLNLGTTSVLLTGDAEADAWTTISSSIPQDTKVFQAPHHGALNGLRTSTGSQPWLTPLQSLPTKPLVGISCHPVPHGHPDGAVINELKTAGLRHYRTDEHYHLRFETDGNLVSVKYSHV